MPTPGTVVPSGSEVSPSGDQGTSGVQGQQGVQGTPGPNPVNPLVVGGNLAEPSFPTAIIIPAFHTHPDALWTPMNAFDDHFDGASLNPKWTFNASNLSGAAQVGASQLLMHGQAAGDTVVRSCYISQNLPNSQPFTLRAKLKAFLYPLFGIPVGNQSQGTLQWNLGTATVNNVQLRCYQLYDKSSGLNSSYFQVIYGPTGALSITFMASGEWPPYVMMAYLANGSVFIQISYDGTNWNGMMVLPATDTGFNTTPPTQMSLQLNATYGAQVSLLCDWIRFTNP